MNKTEILKAILENMKTELQRQVAANAQASAGATHSESRAESKYDTCGLEASYLARGHAQQFKSLVAELQKLQAFLLPDCAGGPVVEGALIEVKAYDEQMYFFLLPYGGGEEVVIDGVEVTVVTPESPVGGALVGKSPGDEYSFREGFVGQVLSVA